MQQFNFLFQREFYSSEVKIRYQNFAIECEKWGLCSVCHCFRIQKKKKKQSQIGLTCSTILCVGEGEKSSLPYERKLRRIQHLWTSGPPHLVEVLLYEAHLVFIFMREPEHLWEWTCLLD